MMDPGRVTIGHQAYRRPTVTGPRMIPDGPPPGNHPGWFSEVLSLSVSVPEMVTAMKSRLNPANPMVAPLRRTPSSVYLTGGPSLALALGTTGGLT